MPQLAQGCELGEAKKPEGVAMLRLAFQRADHERAGEALAEAHALGAIKIAAARFALRPQPFQLALVRLLDLA